MRDSLSIMGLMLAPMQTGMLQGVGCRPSLIVQQRRQGHARFFVGSALLVHEHTHLHKMTRYISTKRHHILTLTISPYLSASAAQMPCSAT